MGSGGPSGCPDRANHRTLLNDSADMDKQPRQMEEIRTDAIAMIEDDSPAAEVKIGCGDCHHAAGRRSHRCSSCSGDVNTGMGCPRHPIVTALCAELSADWTVDR